MATDNDTTEAATVEADVQPIYVAIDCSKSMNSDAGGGRSLIDLANEIPSRILQAMKENPTLRDTVRVGVVTFSERAEVVVPLGDLDALGATARFPASGDRTAYGELFSLLEREITVALEGLRADNAAPRRPIVFVVTDGAPNDAQGDRDRAFARLGELGPVTPSMVMMGFKDAPDAILRKYVLAHGTSILFSDGADAGAQLQKITNSLVGTIIGVGSAANESATAPGEVDVRAVLLDSIDDSDWDDDDPYG